MKEFLEYNEKKDNMAWHDLHPWAKSSNLYYKTFYRNLRQNYLGTLQDLGHSNCFLYYQRAN